MAKQSVLKLVIDDKEYNDSLKEAQQGMLAFEKAMEDAGGTFERVNKDVLEYTRGIGQMETKSKTVKGRIGEMTNAFTELSARYNRLTDDEKNSPFGEALKSSLEQLKVRIQDGKSELEDINRSLHTVENSGQETGGVMRQLADRFTINVDAMKVFDLGLKAVNGALSVAKDAFGASEANVDEWGRIVQSAHSVYDGFLNALNTGDISGFLGRIDEIVIAARNAYDELDRLGTLQTIQKPEMSRQQTENSRLRQMIMTRRYIPKAEGFDWFGAGMKGGQLLTDNQVRMLEVMLQNGMNKVVDLTKNEVKQSGRAIDAFYDSFAKDIGMTVDEFRRGTSSMEEFDRRVKGAQAYNDWQYQNSFVDIQTGKLISPRGGNPYAQFKGWDVFRVDGERYSQLVNLILQRDQQVGQMYSMQSQAYRTMNRAEGITSRIGGRGGRGGGGGGGGSVVEEPLPIGSAAALTKQMQELRKEQNLVTNTSEWQEYQRQIDDIRNNIKGLTGELEAIGVGGIAKAEGISFTDSIVKQVADAQKALKEKKLDLKIVESKPEKKTEMTLAEGISKMTGGISSMASGIQSLGVELPKGLQDVLGGIQGVVSILTGISTLISAIEAISAADALIPFHTGGVVRASSGYRVPGNWGFDAVPALLTSGETVLTRAQAGNLAAQLGERDRGGVEMQPFVDGEKIFLGMNNTSRRMGKGEIVTTSMLRSLGLMR